MTKANVVQSMCRLPVKLHEMLSAKAKKNYRSKNAELIKRVHESFYGKPRVRVKAETSNER